MASPDLNASQEEVLSLPKTILCLNAETHEPVNVASSDAVNVASSDTSYEECVHVNSCCLGF